MYNITCKVNLMLRKGKNDMQERTTYFNPKAGKTYSNKNGFSYTCLSSEGNSEATFINKANWKFHAHGCQIYKDGTIEWNYSTGGYFDD